MERPLLTAAIGLGFIGLAGALFRWIESPPTDAMSEAAWLQAVGSLLAICVVIGLQQRDRLERRQGVRERACAIVKISQAHVDRFHATLHMQDLETPVENFHTTYDTVSKLCESFPIEGLQTTAAVEEFVRFRGILSLSQSHVEAAMEELRNARAGYPAALELLSLTRMQLSDAGRRLLASL